jgi:hypothetical protein
MLVAGGHPMQNRPRPTPLALTTLLCALLGTVGAVGPDATLALVSFLLVAMPAIEARAREARGASMQARPRFPFARALARRLVQRPRHARPHRRALVLHRRGLMDAVATPLIA